MLVAALIGLNVAVFALWQWARERRGRYQWMMRHFTTSLAALRSGRVHTLVTSAFSQQEPLHLALNVFSLAVFARPLCAALGAGRLLTVYLGGAVASSLSHIAYQNALLPTILRSRQAEARARGLPAAATRTRPSASLDVPAQGASGSAMACTALFACLYPRSQFLLYFVVPVPAWLCASGLVALDLYAALRAEARDRTAHFGHIGGAAFGVAYYVLAIRRRRMGGGGSTGGWGSAQPRGWRGRSV